MPAHRTISLTLKFKIYFMGKFIGLIFVLAIFVPQSFNWFFQVRPQLLLIIFVIIIYKFGGNFTGKKEETKKKD